MQSLKRHIALLFLGGFLFPQVAGSMHYFVVSHDFSSEKNNSYNNPEPDSLFHSCVYHLTGFTSGILPQDFTIIHRDFPSAPILNNSSLENFVHRDNFNFLLRGPPLEHLLHNSVGLYGQKQLFYL